MLLRSETRVIQEKIVLPEKFVADGQGANKPPAKRGNPAKRTMEHRYRTLSRNIAPKVRGGALVIMCWAAIPRLCAVNDRPLILASEQIACD